jgi:hypothetical protein
VIGNRLIALAARRERLLMRAQAQRERIATSVGALAGPIGLVDRAIGGARWLRMNPAVLAAGAVVLVILRPRGAFTVARGGLRVWAAWRALRTPQRRLAWALAPRLFDIVRALGRRFG